MKRISPALLVVALVALPLAGARPSDDALSLVPPEAASAGAVRVADLRTSPLFDRVFSEADRMSCDADAARFLSEAGLDPKQDVDLFVAAGAPGQDGKGWALVAFEGRFDAVKLAAAAAARGARKKTTANGDYFLLPRKNPGGGAHQNGAVAFASNHLVIAGDEMSVVQALERRASGGGGFLAGEGLGRHLSRVDSKASAWALADATRVPMKGRLSGGDADSPASAVVAAMKSVTLVALSATADGDVLKMTATGVSNDADTRANLEDAVRGVLAFWRLAVQEKQPDLVPVLRKFTVSQGKDSVTLSGTLPGSVIRELAERKKPSAR
jgi:hypothetical protein